MRSASDVAVTAAAMAGSSVSRASGAAMRRARLGIVGK